MARVATKTYHPIVKAEAVKVRVYYIQGANPPDYNSPFADFPLTPGAPGSPDVTLNIILPGPMSIGDGVYSLGASQFDAAGNESDLGAFITYPFDFTPLPAPTGGSID